MKQLVRNMSGIMQCVNLRKSEHLTKDYDHFEHSHSSSTAIPPLHCHGNFLAHYAVKILKIVPVTVAIFLCLSAFRR